VLPLLALLLCAPPAWAQDSKARPLFIKGRYLAMKKGDCLRALIVLEQARDRARSSRLRGDIYLGIAQCQLLLGDKGAAKKSLHQALVHNPLIAQYASRYKHDMKRLFEEVLKGAPKKPSASGSLSVVSVHKGAVVLVNGEEVGVVPFTGRVLEGRHRVVVRTRDGKWQHSEAFLMVKGGFVSITATLKKVQGTLTVLSEPQGGRVYVDEEIIGSTPVNKTPLTPGTYSVTVRKDGYEPRTRKIAIHGNKLTTLSLPLKRASLPADAYTSPVRRKRFIWTFVAAGGALAAVITGAALGISVKKVAEDYAATPEDQHARLDELEGSMRRQAVASNVMFGVSGAMVAAAVVIFFWEGGWIGGERRRPAVTPSVGGGAAGIVWTVDF
jgi:hypothetical protein